MSAVLGRRLLLGGLAGLPALSAQAALPAQAAQVDIETKGAATLVRWAGQPGELSLPSPSARTLALPPLSGLPIVAIGFGLASGDSSMEFLVLAVHDGKQPRLLALEPLNYQSPNQRLGTRPATGGDRAVLAFSRDGAIKRSATQWRRENWSDYLAWKNETIADAPVRKPLEGTMQARLAALRTAALAWCATPRSAITVRDIAALGLSPGGFDLG